MHFIVAVGLLRVLHVGQSHSPGLGLNMSAIDGSSEEAACPFAADIPSAEFLTVALAGCTGAALFVAPKEKPLDPPEAAPVLEPAATVEALKLLGRDLAGTAAISVPPASFS